MDPLVDGTFRDAIFRKLPLKDILALKSTSSRYYNIPVNLDITSESQDINDIYSPRIANLEYGDHTKIISKSSILNVLESKLSLIKFVIKPNIIY